MRDTTVNRCCSQNVCRSKLNLRIIFLCEFAAMDSNMSESIEDPQSTVDSGKMLKKMFSVEAPGIVENVDNFIKCCGGLKNIESTFKNSKQRLKFKFRPEDSNSIPLFSERKPTTDLAVKVRRKKKPDGSYDYKFETYGLIETVFHFDDTLCDMQLLPTSNDIRNELLKSDFILNCDPSITLNDESTTLLRHFFYSRFTTPKNSFAQMLKETSDEEESSNLIRQYRKSRKVIGLFIRWEDEIPETVPENIRKHLNMKIFDEQLAEKLKEKLNIRPIWSKHALMSMLNCSNHNLKFTLPLFAFFYENGPFRNLWVKYGYNPKKEKSSKIYQMIEIRSRMSIGNQNYYYKIALFDDNKISYRSNPFKLDEEGLKATTSEDQEPNYVFRPGHLSIFKRTGYQLCDIRMDDVQEIVHENDGNETECTEKDGWCTKGAIERIRIIMNNVINKMMDDPEVASRIEKQEMDCDNIEISEVYDDFMDYEEINYMLDETMIEK